jgi:hypothetical protein
MKSEKLILKTMLILTSLVYEFNHVEVQLKISHLLFTNSPHFNTYRHKLSRNRDIQESLIEV